MAQNGSYNDHKMVKNAPNELKFGPDMYFYEFYQILEDFWKILSKLADFWPKNGHLARFSRRNFETFFSTKNRAFKNAQIWLKISILVTYYVFNKANYGFWMILSFGDFMCLQSCREGGF